MVKLTFGVKDISFDDIPKNISYSIEKTGNYIEVITNDPVAESYFRTKGLS